MSNRWNQYNFSTLHRLSMWGHRWILVPLLIFVWYKHSYTTVVGFKCILNRFWCIIRRPKAFSFIKMSTLHHGWHNKFGLCDFRIQIRNLVLNLSYIDYLLCQIWSICMQYLRCCDHSNNSLFLVTQQVKVLLNFFGEWMIIRLSIYSFNWKLILYVQTRLSLAFLLSEIETHWHNSRSRHSMLEATCMVRACICSDVLRCADSSVGG